MIKRGTIISHQSWEKKLYDINYGIEYKATFLYSCHYYFASSGWINENQKFPSRLLIWKPVSEILINQGEAERANEFSSLINWHGALIEFFFLNFNRFLHNSHPTVRLWHVRYVEKGKKAPCNSDIIFYKIGRYKKNEGNTERASERVSKSTLLGAQYKNSYIFFLMKRYLE